MSFKSKKKRSRSEVESSDAVSDDERELEDTEDEEEEDWSSDFDPSMEVNVQFEVRPISDDNQPAIRRLLQQLLLKGSVDTSGLASLIVEQDGIGSVVQVESEIEEGDENEEGEGGREEGMGEDVTTSSKGDEEVDGEVCGAVAVINLTHHRTNVAVQSLTKYLLVKCQQFSPTLHPQLSQLLASSDQHVGLLVNERYLNIPPHIAPPLLTSLFYNEVSCPILRAVVEVECESAVLLRAYHASLNSAEVKEASGKGLPYNLDNYVLIARSYDLPSPLSSPHTKRQRNDGGETAAKGNGIASNNPVLHCQEYEILQEEAILTFSYPVSGEGCEGGGDCVFGGRWGFEDDSLQQTRTVMVIPASRLHLAINKLSSSFS